MKFIFKSNILQSIAFLVIVLGALGSVCFTLHAGRNNNSVLLPFLFVTWVLSPFIAFLVANLVSKNWSRLSHVILYSFAIVLSLCSLIFYSGVLSLPGAKPAFIFLVIPLVSWVLLAIVVAIAKSLSRRDPKKSDNF